MIFKGIISFTVVIISTMEVIIGTAHRFEVEGSKIPAQSTRKKSVTTQFYILPRQTWGHVTVSRVASPPTWITWKSLGICKWSGEKLGESVLLRVVRATAGSAKDTR